MGVRKEATIRRGYDISRKFNAASDGHTFFSSARATVDVGAQKFDGFFNEATSFEVSSPPETITARNARAGQSVFFFLFVINENIDNNRIVVDRSMIQEVKLKEKTHFMILENYVVGIYRRPNES